MTALSARSRKMRARMPPNNNGTLFDTIASNSVDVPAPNKYDLQHYRPGYAAPAISMTFSKRRNDVASDTPAPGAYDAISGRRALSQCHRTPRITFGEKPKTFNDFNRNAAALGPGSYNVDISTLRRSGAGSFGIRHSYAYKTDAYRNPAPCAYDKNRAGKVLERHQPMISMTFGDKRIFEVSKSQMDIPGMQTYDVKLPGNIKKASKFPKAQPRPDKRDMNPPVGAYNIAEPMTRLKPQEALPISMSFRHSHGEHF